MPKLIIVRPGDQYDHLTVACESGEMCRRRRMFICRCDCGREITLSIKILRKGGIKSCNPCRYKRLSDAFMNHSNEPEIGQVFGQYQVFRQGTNRSFWCLCLGCKRETLIRKSSLVAGAQECKVCNPAILKTPESLAFYNIISRCNNPNHPSYKDYGGRGITVCERWRNSCEAFLEDILREIGRRPSPEYSIDRKNNDGNYEPGNIKWSTQKEQMRNQRKTWRILYKGSLRPVRDICEELGVRYERVRSRKRHGCSDHRLFFGLV